MSYQGELKLYQKAIDELIALGYKRGAELAQKTQKGMKAKLEAYLRELQIDGPTKQILTTDQNWALTAKVIADLEDEIDMSFVKPGRTWISEVKQRAYFAGMKYEAQLIKGGSVSDAQILQGVSGTMLKAFKETGQELVTGIAQDQVDYLRRALTEAVIHNRSWTDTTKRIIRDGKIPALEVIDKNGVARYIEPETRVDMIVRTETARIAEQGSHDKAAEFYGEDLWGRWHTTTDGRERESHAARNGMLRSEKDWMNVPGPDGKVIMPGQEVNCRCWMEWGDKATLEGRGEPAPPPPQPEPPAPPGDPGQKGAARLYDKAQPTERKRSGKGL